VGQAKPAVIGLDMFLSEARAAPMRMRPCSARSPLRAMWWSRIQAGTGQLPAVLPLTMFCQPENPALPTGFCVEGKPGAFAYAAVNMPFDSDGYVRDAELIDMGQTEGRELSRFLAEEYLAQVDPQCSNCTLQPLDKGNAQFRGSLCPFAIGCGNLSHRRLVAASGVHISAWDVLTGSVAPAQFHNKLVLIGQGSDAARDRDFSPLFRVNAVRRQARADCGTELHAAAIETLLMVTPSEKLPVWLRWCVNFASAGRGHHGYSRAFGSDGFSLELPSSSRPFMSRRRSFYLVSPLVSLPGDASGRAAALPCGVAWQYVKANLLRSETEQQRKQLMEMFSRYVDPAGCQRHLASA
jgi:adenylate cyclase